MKVAYILPAFLSVANAGMHINYYSDTNCQNWIGQKNLGQGWGDQTFTSLQGTHSALPVETTGFYKIEFYDQNSPNPKYTRFDGQCWGTTGKVVTHIKPW
ncbi:hypothetical protein BGZ61DRAFT_539231 [Ilyonectria robusta]|uniref:uncharacterized protein n=1 Tax=Ilyonectria robusta TaxID=1079257 RepID=UPI001E8D0C19|nr:uncharacterized protein BGZ61DRAFT_539231 [Ilyonectria robusta]KAH8663202.1 hypothetical protein BGZ61DRAFT_539231 [Ilyonectria robusta]